jgi:nucleoid-associated protein YgaU
MISLGPTVPRCLGVWGGVTAAGALVCRGVAADLRVAGDADLETWLVAVAAAALVLAACWASAVAGVVCVQVARRAPVPRAGVPAPVRRLLLRACGVAVAGGLAGGLALTPAGATPGSLERERATSAATPSASPAPVSAPAPADRVVVVRPGDSLWRIAEAELLRRTGRAASVADVAALWPRIYAANRALVGPDPDLVRPGVPLTMPAPSPQES